ncbi:MAG: DUF6515 family protein, partial [Limisphaerales bacterium]
PRDGVSFASVLLALWVASPLLGAERGAPRGAAASHGPAAVDRTSHGSIRHADTHVVQRPVEVRPEPARSTEPRHEVTPPRDVRVHRDVEVDVHRPHLWDDFAFGRRLAALPRGFLSLRICAVTYFYCGGVYYQAVNGGYQEVYPPVGAEIPQPPEGAIQIVAGNLVYYYAGGAFYTQQPDGTYGVAPTPMGVVVPELPPGAVQVAVNGAVAYQFNGVYYEPVFVNGVTQYETFMPQ